MSKQVNYDSPSDEVKRLRKNNKMLAKALADEKLQVKEWTEKYNNLRNEFLNLLELHNCQKNKLEKISLILSAPQNKTANESEKVETTNIPLQQNTNVIKSFKHFVKPMISGHAITLPNIYLKRMNLGNMESEEDKSDEENEENEGENNFITVRRQCYAPEANNEVLLDILNTSEDNSEDTSAEENIIKPIPSPLGTIVEESFSENIPFVAMSTPIPMKSKPENNSTVTLDVVSSMNQSLGYTRTSNIESISPILERRDSSSDFCDTTNSNVNEQSQVFINFRRPKKYTPGSLRSSRNSQVERHETQTNADSSSTIVENSLEGTLCREDDNFNSSNARPSLRKGRGRKSNTKSNNKKQCLEELTLNETEICEATNSSLSTKKGRKRTTSDFSDKKLISETSVISQDFKQPITTRQRQKRSKSVDEPSSSNINFSQPITDDAEITLTQRTRRKPANYREPSLKCKLRH